MVRGYNLVQIKRIEELTLSVLPPPYYSHTGRPSIDPVLMIRMLLVSYVFALRSERRLCSEVQVNLAYRWFCKLSVEDQIPDHSVFSRARHEPFRESDALRRVFEGVVAMCVGGTTAPSEAGPLHRIDQIVNRS
jgi:transposase